MILFVLEMVLARDFSKGVLFSDALEVVKAINGEAEWVIESVISDILRITSSFDKFYSNYTPKEMNEAAHSLHTQIKNVENVL